MKLPMAENPSSPLVRYFGSLPLIAPGPQICPSLAPNESFGSDKGSSISIETLVKCQRAEVMA